jgi:hypothetical protein
MNNKLMMLINWVAIKAVKYDEQNKRYLTAVYGAPGQDNEYSVEQVHNYGFTSFPLQGAEGITLSPIGDQTQAVIISAQDRRYQIKIESGEVAIYTHKNLENAHRILLKKDGNIEILGGEVTLSDKVKLGGPSGTLKKLVNESLISWLSTHTHLTAGTGASSPPTEPIPSNVTTQNTEAS